MADVPMSRIAEIAQLVDAFSERRAELDWNAHELDALNSEIVALTTLIDEGKLQLPEDTIAGNLGGILALYGDLLPPDARAALLFATAFVNEMAELGAEVDQSVEAQQLLAGATRH